MIDELLKRLEHVPPTMLKKLLKGFLWEGTPDSGTCALTFDDGPDPEITPLVMDVLEEAGIRGTFYLIGDNVQKYPDIAASIAERGHTIGNHTKTHPRMILLSRREAEVEIEMTQEIINVITGITPTWFRPPYGMFDFTSASVVKKEGLSMTLWTVLSGDYSDDSSEQILNTITPFIRPGAIIVFHDTLAGGGRKLPGILRDVIDIAEKNGIKLGGIGDLSISDEIILEDSNDD